LIKELVVLGSGGSRFVTITQVRRTGGLLLVLNNGYFVTDPGPGSLSYFNQLGFNPFKVKGVLISHRHIDHYCDAGVYIEAMTNAGTKRRGLLAASKSVIETIDEQYPVISDYHIKLVEKCAALAAGDKFTYDGISITACKAIHYDRWAIGFKFNDGKRSISYLPDTEFGVEVAEDVKNSDLLILCVLRQIGRAHV